MNKNLLNARKIFIDFKEEMGKLEAEKALLKEQNEAGYYSPNAYKEKMAFILAKCEVLKDDAMLKYKTEMQAYIDELDKWAVLDGEQLSNSDLAIINSGIELSERDYRNMLEKYSSNYTALRFLTDSAKKNGIDLTSEITIDVNEKIKAFNEVVELGKSLVRDTSFSENEPAKFESYFSRLWSNEEAFNKSYQSHNQTMEM